MIGLRVRRVRPNTEWVPRRYNCVLRDSGLLGGGGGGGGGARGFHLKREAVYSRGVL